jgi:nucleotide-binding universal stress UspA family protein
MTPRSILAVTDFSQQGGHALARAALCCAEHGATLKIVYLAEAGEAPPSDTDVRLAHHAVQLGQRYDIAVQAATQTACDAEQVARKASGADLVVWGTAPVQGLRAWFTTHPALRMLRTCPRPVIVVRNPAHQPYQGLMVAVDFSRASHSLVDLGLALHPCARVELFHAISTANEGKLRYAEVSERAIQIYREQCRRSAQDRMVTLTDSHDARRNRLSSSIGRGDPVRQILVQQQHSAADLVVVGKHPASMVSDLLFESIAQRLLGDGRVDVLVVPHGFQAASRTSAVERLAPELPVRRVRSGAPPRPHAPDPPAIPTVHDTPARGRASPAGAWWSNTHGSFQGEP